MELQTFRNPKPDLVALLAESGPAGDANGVRGGKGDAAKKKSRNRDKNVSSAAWLDTGRRANGISRSTWRSLPKVCRSWAKTTCYTS
jgi:hypothetical protein